MRRGAPDIEVRVIALGAEITPFSLEERALAWDPAEKTAAAAEAEGRAVGAEQLVWADCDTLILQDLRVVELGASADVGFRPVYGVNIGSRFSEPLDDFWALAYNICGVSEADVFPMTPCTTNAQLRPYINLGFVVVRPSVGILQRWQERCTRLLTDPRAKRFSADDRYESFIHQAVLSAVATSRARQARMRELPESVNYARSEHDDYPEARRPRRLNDLVTRRYEYPFEVNSWRAILPPEPPLSSWLDERMESLRPLLDPERLKVWSDALAKNKIRT
jgi:hypothetical protein